MITASLYRNRPIRIRLTCAAELPRFLRSLFLPVGSLDYFPNVTLRMAYGAIASNALMWALVFLSFCSMTLVLTRNRRKADEGLLILGADDLARDLCRRAHRRRNGGALGEDTSSMCEQLK